MIHYQIVGTTAGEIAGCIEAAIELGDIPAGTALPPIRSLAGSLGVSPGTVAAAYRRVRDRGLTIPDGRRGTAVRPARDREAAGRRPGGGVSGRAPTGIVDLSSGNPDPELMAPLRRVFDAFEPRTVLYGCPPCLPELGELMGEALERDGVPGHRRGAGEGGELTATSGTLDAAQRILGGCLRPGDTVAVEDPGWHAMIELARSLALRLRPVPVDPEGPDPSALWQALASGARAVVMTARAQNPTGAAVSTGRAAELRAVLGRYPDVLVLEDDHGFAFTGLALCPVAGSTKRFAFVRSLSKAYGPDLRLAVVSSDPATARAIESSYRTGAGWVSHLLQGLGAALLGDAEVARHLERARATYDERRLALVKALAVAGIAVEAPSGLNVWVPVDDEASAVGSVLGEGWLVAEGRGFRIGAAPAVRVTTSALDPGDAPGLAEALARAAAAKGRPSA
ncbi:MAG: aminotransferase class I/II-fold pyridoxal phosphate-dependent enzyme [Acidimicrobiales bacterium]